MLTFDHATKRIGVPATDAAPLLIQNLINAIRTEEASERGIVEPMIATAAGKDSLGGSVTTGITVSLQGSWKLLFEAGAYQATIDGGNLAAALAHVANTGSPQVLVQSSAAATIAETGTSGLTPEEAALLASISTVPASTLALLLANVLKANVKQVNDIPIKGAGVPGNTWGPA